MATQTENPLSVNEKYRYHSLIGLLSASAEGFSGPVSIALGPNDLLYVASRGNPNQRESVRITKCTKDGEYVDQFGGWGEKDGEFIWVTDIGFNSRNEVLLTEEHQHRLQAFDTDGNLLYAWGERGSEEGQFDRPSGLVVDSEDNVYIVDSLNHRVQKFTREGEFLFAWGELGDGDGQFNMPWDIALDSDGNVYVSDWRNDRVQKFTDDGAFLTSFGQSGTGDGEFNRPNGLTVSSDGDIYVCDWMNDRVQILGADGSYKDTLIGHGGTSKWSERYLDANPDIKEKLELATQNIEIKKRFYRPVSVKVDDDGKVYVVDCYRHRVQIYEKL